nr:hypothetical protein [Corynebacterium macginleyi]
MAQWWLWRQTRRRFNRGFLTATVLLFFAIFWGALSNFVTWSTGHQGFETASRPWDSLTASRIEAQQARTSETLALVLRSSEEDTLKSFSGSVESIEKALGDYESALHDDDVEVNEPELILSTRAATEKWQESHEKLMDALSEGDYDEAIYQATVTDPEDGETTAAQSFNELDSELSDLIGQARIAMRTYLERGLIAMTAVSSAVFLLTLCAIFAVWLGIRPRLQEYL